MHAERQHDGEDHRLWHGQGARTRRSSQGALRDPRVCRSGGNFHLLLFSLNSDTFCPERYQKDQYQLFKIFRWSDTTSYPQDRVSFEKLRKMQ